MLSLPDELASRMRSVIPLSEIDNVIASLLEKEISIREAALYLTAKEVEEDTELRKEMASRLPHIFQPPLAETV